MKLVVLLAFIAVSTFVPDITHAQLVVSGIFAPSQVQDFSTTVTLTTTGPLTLLASAHETAPNTANSPSITINVIFNGAVIGTFTLYEQLGATTTMANLEGSGALVNLSPGTYTLDFPSNSGNFIYTYNYTLIAGNEPPSGAQSAINTLSSQISTLQTNEAADANNINILQAVSSNQASQITALQTAEAQDASEITALQTQLQAIDTTLQNEITQDEANIAALQNGQGNQTGQISTLQQQVSQLESQVQTLQTLLAADSSAPTATSQYTALQNQLSSLKSTNKDQWIALGAVGLLGATGTAISAYELSHGGNSPPTSSATSGTKTGSYNPYGSNVSSYTKKN